jgi:hypothetical protein
MCFSSVSDLALVGSGPFWSDQDVENRIQIPIKFDTYVTFSLLTRIVKTCFCYFLLKQ